MTNERLHKLEKLLIADPGDAFVLYGLASEHAKLGDVAKAVEFFDRCLATDPDYLYAYYHKAKVLSDHEQTRNAAETLNIGIARAKARQDAKALNELSALLDQIT